MAEFRLIGLRVPICELVQVPFEVHLKEDGFGDTEPFRAALQSQLLELAFDSSGGVDETFVYVCALNERGAIVSRVETLMQGDDGLVFDVDFELEGAAGGDPFTVILVRLAREESVIGTIEAATAREAGEAGLRYAMQSFGNDNDLLLVAVVAPDGSIEITAENWGNG